MPGTKTHSCTAVADTVTNLATGFTTLPAGTTFAFNSAFTGESFVLVLGDTSSSIILGFQVPSATCDVICHPVIRHCVIERVCEQSLIVGGVIESTVNLTPVVFTQVGTVAVGTATQTRNIQQRFHCAIDLDQLKNCCPQECQTPDFEICACTLCPMSTCLEDTSQLIVNSFVVPAGTPEEDTPANQVVCVAQSLRQVNSVRITIRQRKDKKKGCPRKKKQAGNKCKLPTTNGRPVLSAVTPSCVTFPDVVQSAANAGRQVCVTLGGCNLDKSVAVLFNSLVCGSIVSVNENSIAVRVPCAISLVGQTLPGGTVTILSPPQLVNIQVVDACGQMSNSVSLQIACPVPVPPPGGG